MAKLHDLLRSDSPRTQPILAVVAGSGLVASCAVEAGADLLIVLNAGLYRNLGTGSLAAFLPYGNANDQTDSLLCEQVLPRTQGVPVVAGVFAADETVRLETRLKRLKALGVAGVVNWPAIGFLDGRFREAVEAEGIGTACEANMLALARAMGFATLGFALSPHEVASFLDVGVDGLVLDLGLTRDVVDARQRRDQLQTAIVRLNAMLATANRLAPGKFCLAFGGPITTPEDLEQVFRHADVHGFAGGSVFERLPVQSVLVSTVRRFKNIPIGPPEKAEERGLGALVGRSAAMREVFQLIRQVAPHDVNVCIEGETGTGKELVAMQLHRLSGRAAGPFITLNCGAIPETLLESELFGHEKGAFTNADRRRPGKFELAQGGTLFLDEIADLSPRGQVAILRAIQQREIMRVGADRSLPIDVRIIAASNQPLAKAVQKGRFREDLYYRLNYITIRVPPLCERIDDLPLLAKDILARLQVQLDRRLAGLSPSFQEKMLRHGWPGNVRELEHVLGQAALREERTVLEGRYFTPMPRPFESCICDPGADGEPHANHRKKRAQEAIAAARGNKSRAAAALGITRKTLYAWLREED